MAEYTIELYEIGEPVKLTRVVLCGGGIGLHEQIFTSVFAAFAWIMEDACPPNDDIIRVEYVDTPIIVENRKVDDV